MPAHFPTDLQRTIRLPFYRLHPLMMELSCHETFNRLTASIAICFFFSCSASHCTCHLVSPHRKLVCAVTSATLVFCLLGKMAINARLQLATPLNHLSLRCPPSIGPKIGVFVMCLTCMSKSLQYDLSHKLTYLVFFVPPFFLPFPSRGRIAVLRSKVPGGSAFKKLKHPSKTREPCTLF